VTAAQIKINGTITVNAGGTLTVQFAQNGAVPATTSSVLVGSTFTVHNVP
jgi:UDP-N-acetylglucosamine enolpyruvyl transferase